MKIYSDHYYCFGCGKAGDSTDLVAYMYGLRPIEAAQKIASDFGINIDSKSSTDYSRIKPTQTSEQIFLNRKRSAIQNILKKIDHYHEIKLQAAPNKLGDAFCDEYIDAVSQESILFYHYDILNGFENVTDDIVKYLVEKYEVKEDDN